MPKQPRLGRRGGIVPFAAHRGRNLPADRPMTPSSSAARSMTASGDARAVPAIRPGDTIQRRRTSVQQGLPIRRLLTKDQTPTASGLVPMPYMTAAQPRTSRVRCLAQVRRPVLGPWPNFGHDPMYWYRLDAGWAVQRRGDTLHQAEVPNHLCGRRASPNPRWREGLHRHDRRGGCVLGAEPALGAGADT